MSLRSSTSFANVTSMLALVIALGGSAYAATIVTGADVKNGSLSGLDIAKDSLKRADIASNAVGSAEIRDRAVASDDLGASVLDLLGKDGAAGPKGDPGLAGPQGVPGPKGDRGVPGVAGTDARVDVYNLHEFRPAAPSELTLPAGTYFITAKTGVTADSNTPTGGQCLLTATPDGQPFDSSQFQLDAVGDVETLPLQMTATLTAENTVKLRCSAMPSDSLSTPGTLRMIDVDISALRVDSVNP